MPANDNGSVTNTPAPVETPVQEKTQDEKINEAYVAVGELVVKYATIEQQAQEIQAKAQDLQIELRTKVDELRNELRIREGVRLSGSAN